MFGINLKHSVATVAVAVGVLTAAGSAGAATHPSAVLYNGHAGLGANVTDGTSNTVMFGARVLPGDAYALPDIDDQVL